MAGPSNHSKGSFYIAQYPVRSKRFTRFALPDRPAHSDTNYASPGSIVAMQQLFTTTKYSHLHHGIARCSFIQLSQQGRQWRERKCPIFETVAKGDSNPGSLDCESGILPLSYRAPHLTPIPPLHRRRGATTVFGENRHHRSDTASNFS